MWLCYYMYVELCGRVDMLLYYHVITWLRDNGTVLLCWCDVVFVRCHCIAVLLCYASVYVCVVW